MPKDNWQMKDGQTGENYIAPEREHLFPALGNGAVYDFVPDAEWLEKRKTQYITKEQEKYGIDYDPKHPPGPKRKTRPKEGLNPISGKMEPWPEKEEKAK